MNFCLAWDARVIDLPPRCTKSPGHTGEHRAWAGNGSHDYITWED